MLLFTMVLLAASGYNHTPILTFLHMCAPSSTILLHQRAEEQASALGITPSFLMESQALRLAAAEMVASTMRLTSNMNVRLLEYAEALKQRIETVVVDESVAELSRRLPVTAENRLQRLVWLLVK